MWGTGAVAKTIFNECMELFSYEILGIIDNNKEKVGDYFYGCKIFAPDVLKSVTPDAIVVLTDLYEEIKKQIKKDFPEYDGLVEKKDFFYKNTLLQKYKYTENTEIKTVLKYIEENGLNVFNYSFAKKYDNLPVVVYYDEECSLFYVFHHGKKMYFSKKLQSSEQVQNYYKSILLEQDEASPHRYFTKTFQVKQGDVVIDAGVAEGNFALEIVDYVSKIYLIEADDDWISALQNTFKDYMDKVVIVKGYLSEYNYGNIITLDSIINESVDFIKMDIEGNEWEALNGAKELIHRCSKLKLAVCCYHSDFDQELIESFFDKMAIKHEHSEGYMWFPYTIKQKYVSTKLNRGMIRAEKCTEN